MRRKPSASHCVKKLPPDTYRPDSVVFSAGLQMLVSVSSKLSGTLSSMQAVFVRMRVDEWRRRRSWR